MAPTPKRTGGAKAPESEREPPDLVVRGLTRDDVTALEAEHARRQAALPEGAKLSRNAVAVALLREALAAAAARAKGGST